MQDWVFTRYQLTVARKVACKNSYYIGSEKIKSN